jgi:hypothetical protein
MGRQRTRVTWCFVSMSRYILTGGIESQCLRARSYLIWLPSSLMHKRVLTYKIMMRQRRRLRQPRRATTIQSRRCRALRNPLIIKAHPILLTMLHKRFPRPEPCRDGLLQDIEDPNVGLGDGTLFRGREHAVKHLGLCDQELAPGGLDVVHELQGRVGRVRAGEDAACGDDAEEEH